MSYCCRGSITTTMEQTTTNTPYYIGNHFPHLHLHHHPQQEYCSMHAAVVGKISSGVALVSSWFIIIIFLFYIISIIMNEMDNIISHILIIMYSNIVY